MHGKYNPFVLKRDTSDGCERNAPFTLSISCIYPVSRTAGEGRAEFSKGGRGLKTRGGRGGIQPAFLGRINVYLVGTYYTGVARSRRWCEWRGGRGRGGS